VFNVYQLEEELAAGASPEAFSSKQLKAILSSRGIGVGDCFEKSDLVSKIRLGFVQEWLGRDVEEEEEEDKAHTQSRAAHVTAGFETSSTLETHRQSSARRSVTFNNQVDQRTMSHWSHDGFSDSLDDDEIDHDRVRASAASGAATGSDERHEASEIHQSEEVAQGRLRTDEANLELPIRLPSTLTLETHLTAAEEAEELLELLEVQRLLAGGSGAAAQLRQNMNRLNMNSSYRAVIMTPRPGSVIINTRRDKNDEIQEESEIQESEVHGPDVPSGPIPYSSR
jgi:hypothetical protein